MTGRGELDEMMSRFRGCLLAGAVGDALGAPIEFLLLSEIRARYGPSGITGMVEGAWPRGSITDDTQMTLFTAEGLLRAWVRGALKGICHGPTVVDHAYARWFHTQGERCGRWERFNDGNYDGWLVALPELHARRAPGNTCLSAMHAGRAGTIEEPLNDSKGCGGVMRVAPVALAPPADGAFAFGAEVAALTHGHPSGHLSAGFLALAVQRLCLGAMLDAALDDATRQLRASPHHSEVDSAIAAARRLAKDPATPETVKLLGEGWVAEEALAIAIYAVAATDSLRDALLIAVNHSGDSDSTGAIAGNIAGALYGETAIPEEWLEHLELREVIAQIAEDLYRCWRGEGWDPQREAERYPGW
jgi:ADP-ribosylglycohydrolase